MNIIVKETIKDIKLNRFDKGSIPDAWIFIELSSKQLYLFIIENKKYNLDPNQINNHIEKSLFQIKDSDKNKPIYRSFVELSKCMEGIKTYMSEQFAEYLMILGYVGLESLPLACLADVDIRKNLAMNAGRTVMKEIFGQDVNDRSSSTVRYTINPHFDFLREVNLCFDRCDKEDGTIYVSLALAPTMNSAKKMYELIDFKTHFKNEHIKYPKESFHLQYNRGRNIRKSYINGFNWNFNDYIKYWKNNTKKLHLMSTIEAGEFIVDLSKQGNYPCNQAEKFKEYIIKRHNPINVVPELIYEISWTCEEISQMNSNYEFENSLKKALSEVLDMLNLKIVGINNM